MSVRVVRRGDRGWQVDIRFRLPNGQRSGERRVLPGVSKSAATRWGQERERHLFQHGPAKPKKEVPTFEEFKDRFLDGYARANQQKPSGIAAKEMILRVHLVPFLGHKRLDTISNADVQRLKAWLHAKRPKTVNNILTVLNTLLKIALEWGVIDRIPCPIAMLPVPKVDADFYDFEEFKRLVAVGGEIDWRTELIILLGGEAGIRCGEMIALEWADVNFATGQLCIRRSDWNGQVTIPKGGRGRYIRMMVRLAAAALREHRHLRSERVLCMDDGSPLTRQMVQNRMKLACRRANASRSGVHILRHTFCSHLC